MKVLAYVVMVVFAVALWFVSTPIYFLGRVCTHIDIWVLRMINRY